MRRVTRFSQLLHPGTDVEALFVFREAARFFRFSFGDLLAKTLDRAGPIRRRAAFEGTIYRLDLGDLFLGKIGAVFRDDTLLLKFHKVAPVRRKRLNEIHGDRMLNNIALAREIA